MNALKRNYHTESILLILYYFVCCLLLIFTFKETFTLFYTNSFIFNNLFEVVLFKFAIVIIIILLLFFVLLKFKNNKFSYFILSLICFYPTIISHVYLNLIPLIYIFFLMLLFTVKDFNVRIFLTLMFGGIFSIILMFDLYEPYLSILYLTFVLVLLIFYHRMSKLQFQLFLFLLIVSDLVLLNWKIYLETPTTVINELKTFSKITAYNYIICGDQITKIYFNDLCTTNISLASYAIIPSYKNYSVKNYKLLLKGKYYKLYIHSPINITICSCMLKH